MLSLWWFWRIKNVNNSYYQKNKIKSVDSMNSLWKVVTIRSGDSLKLSPLKFPDTTASVGDSFSKTRTKNDLKKQDWALCKTPLSEAFQRPKTKKRFTTKRCWNYDFSIKLIPNNQFLHFCLQVEGVFVFESSTSVFRNSVCTGCPRESTC